MTKFQEYLKSQSESSLWNGEGDDQNDGMYYLNGAASCFFLVAARELVKEGMDKKNIASFCVEGALTALHAGGLPIEDAENELMRIVLSYRISDELTEKAQ